MAHRDRLTPGQADNPAGAATPLFSDWPLVSRLSIMARMPRIHSEAEYTTAPVSLCAHCFVA
jgi:hypothetical protein